MLNKDNKNKYHAETMQSEDAIKFITETEDCEKITE